MILTPRTHILLAGLLWSTLLFALPPVANAGQILGAPTYIGLGNRLVGWWTFDGKDVAGDIAYDRSGQGNSGTLTNGPIRTIGKIGQALEFDGTNDLVEIIDPGTGSVLDFANGSSLTISTWYKPDSIPAPTGVHGLVGKEGSFQNYFLFLGDDINSQPRRFSFYYVKSDGSASHQYSIDSDAAEVGKWSHVAVTYTFGAGSSVKLYVDGILRSGSWYTGNGNDAPSQGNAELDIGSQDRDVGVADGHIDDVRIYNRILSADEIKRLYKIGATLKYGAPNSTGSLASGLVGHWTFDGNDMAYDGAGKATAYDISGNGNTASSTTGGAGAGPQNVVGKIGQGMQFDASNDVLDAGSGASLDNITRMTISVWIKPTGASGEILAKQNDGSGGANGPDLWHDLQEIWFARGFDGGGASWRTGNVLTGAWQHLVLRYDNSDFTNDPQIFVDGVAQAVIDNTAPSGTRVDDSADDLGIGRYGARTSETAHFGGLMDDLRIYNRMVTDDEIKRLYKMGSTLKQGVASSNGSLSNGLVGWWTFDGKDVTKNSSSVLTAYDRSGSGNHATSSSSAIPGTTFGKMGQALQFASSTNSTFTVMQTKHNSAIDDLPQKTISLWVYMTTWGAINPAAGGGVSTFIDKRNSTLVSPLTWGLAAVQSVPYLVFEQGFSLANGQWSTDADVISLNKWHHIAISYDRTNIANVPVMYINGVAQTIFTDVPPSGSATSDAGSGIAIGQAGAGSTFATAANSSNAKIDDVRIYNRLLSADEMKRLYNMGR